jgi:lactobin A/cerein 7B family class IIb bacteriocin
MIMKQLDLKALKVEELNDAEMTDTCGGILPFGFAVLIGIAAGIIAGVFIRNNV